MKNIRIVLLGELVLLASIFCFVLFTCGGGLNGFTWFLDIPSIVFILLFLIPGLIVMDEWKNFTKAFSVGIKKFSLLELKNIIGAISAAQKLIVYGALFSMIISGVIILGHIPDYSTIGPNLAVCFLAAFYAVILEFFLLPLKLNAEHKMNEEMDFGDD